MSCPRLACLVIDHHICVTVVSADKHCSVCSLNCTGNLANTFIYYLNSLNCCWNHTGVSNHIRISKVCYNHIIFLRVNSIKNLLANFRSTHLRLKVIGRNILRAVYKYSVLALVWLLNTTVKEECNVSILLCLSNSSLLHSLCCKPLTKGVVEKDFLKCNFLVRNKWIIICKANISNIKALTSVKLIKIIIAEAMCDFSCPVRTEVIEND